ncbi:putative cellulose synthase A catalytic subunit 2 [UDP-forming] [Capsicum annuum]|uniref:SHSP domain-containing protein n=1 Tax=Capsicum annuum TaxID=4072 RepID=A0A1U8EV61_CAPAN|nr:uncharacterized protein LOC107850800 [Capsicum annuum]KAF3635452.1 putative cellulose synthase A catalytic subunit 2 [UDP-forming] [Capsicum annuum]KAF3649547.1 putative cellulose synthase A catalytic subunit 2 [UDP-forming] [Capsicum annuum]PHT65920.1 hypothetical protein T459_30345 [Capsicum annuum]
MLNQVFPNNHQKMDWGSKVTRVADEFASNELPQFLRDRAGLFFLSTETDTMFILTAYLKGYTRGNIKMDIIEEGTKMVVACEKPVQETVAIGSKVIKKDVAIRKFTKVFKIPVGVILDQIKTNLNEEASILTITMPKRVTGILGTGIQEVEEAEFSSASPESGYQKEQVSQETEMQFAGFPTYVPKAHEEVEKQGAKDEVPRRETEKPKAEPNRQKDDKVCEKANGIKEEEKRREEDKLPEGRSKICVPVIAGSAVILSLVVFVIHFMRKKNQSRKRKE